MNRSKHGPARVPRGLLATLGGGILLLGGLFLSLACCWAPALVIGLGLTTVFAALHGFRVLFMVIGGILVVGGLAWAISKRLQNDCDCKENPHDA